MLPLVAFLIKTSFLYDNDVEIPSLQPPPPFGNKKDFLAKYHKLCYNEYEKSEVVDTLRLVNTV